MGNIPVQQTPGARGGNYGSLPGANVSVSSADIARGKPKRGIYGKHEQFKERKSDALAPGAYVNQASAITNSVGNLAKSVGSLMLQHKEKVQNAVDFGGSNQAEMNIAKYYAGANTALKNNKNLESFDKIVEQTQDIGENLWEGVDKGELSEKALERINAYADNEKSKFGIRANASRESLLIEKSKFQVENRIEMSILSGNKQEGLQAIQHMVALKHYSKEEAKLKETKYLSRFAFHDAYTVARNQPDAILEVDENGTSAINRKELFSYLDGGQRDKIYGFANAEKNRRADMQYREAHVLAKSGNMSPEQLKKSLDTLPPKMAFTVEQADKTAKTIIKNDMLRAKSKQITQNISKIEDIDARRSQMQKISEKEIDHLDDLMEKGELHSSEINMSLHTTTKQKNRLQVRLARQEQRELGSEEFQDVLTAISSFHKGGDELVAGKITDLRKEYGFSDAVISKAIGMFQEKQELLYTEDTTMMPWSNNAMKPENVKIFQELYRTFKPIMAGMQRAGDTQPVYAFEKLRMIQKELEAEIGSGANAETTITKMNELTAPIIKEFVLKSVAGTWSQDISGRDYTEGLEPLLIKMETLMTDNEYKEFNAQINAGVNPNDLINEYRRMYARHGKDLDEELLAIENK